MKKKTISAFITALALLMALAGCGQSAAPEGSASADGSTSSATEQPSEGNSTAESAEEGGKNIYTDWLPAGVEQVMSETEANPELQRAIIDYYEIPEEDWDKTKYYYNYVDLNGDGTDEILAVVMGSYTSGTGGDSMLWLLPSANMAVAQSFTLVHTPIIVTKDALNGQEFGAKGLIVLRSGGGAKTEPVLLKNVDGEYTQVSDAEPVEDLDSVEGTAIICNDLIADTESGNYLTLAD